MVLKVNLPDSFTKVVGELVGKDEIKLDGILDGGEEGLFDGCEEGTPLGTAEGKPVLTSLVGKLEGVQDG